MYISSSIVTGYTNNVQTIRLIYDDESYAKSVVKAFQKVIKEDGKCTINDLRCFCNVPYYFTSKLELMGIDPKKYGWTVKNGVKSYRVHYEFIDLPTYFVDFPSPVKLKEI